MLLWRIGVDAPGHEAHDLSGRGAERTGGRWNRPGQPVVYASGSIALACLETLVHLNAGGLPLNRYLVRLEVPDALWAVRSQWTAAELPVGWDAVPEGKVSLDLGDAWLKGRMEGRDSALACLPSAIVPEEFNLLLNPAHPDARQVRATKLRRWLYDPRLPAPAAAPPRA